MKSLKKSVVFLVVLTMVLSTVAPVFAATPTDVVGTDYEDAVGKLVTLGVIAGYEDGTFKPDQNITRAEFSKIACYVVGVKDAAELSKGATKFKDVPATHWASGYVNIASEKGMLKGYPDGTFKPEANVTYAEAVTILVRALGMGPVVEGKGTWPANYLSRAAAAGITDDVAGLTATGSAVRGAIAQLAWNTLDAEKWGEKEYNVDGIVYGPLNKALIKDVYPDFAYVGANNEYVTKSFEGITVVGTQLAGNDLQKNEIQLDVENEEELKNLIDDGNTPKVEVLDESVDLNSLFGKKVNLLLGKDNKIAYVAVADKDVVAGKVTDFVEDEDKIEVNDKEYAFKSDAIVYLNGVSMTALNDVDEFEAADYNTIVAAVDQSTVVADLVLDGGKIKAARLSVADAIDPVHMTQGVIDEIKSNGEVRSIDDGAKLFDLDEVTSDKDYSVIVKNGKPATEEDLKEGDVVTYLTNGTLYVVYASDVTVTGEVTKVSSDGVDNNGDARKKLTIDGKEYQITADGTAMMSKTGDTDDAVAVDETVADFKGETVTLKLNTLGEVEYISGDVDASAAAQIGVVTKDPTENGDGYNVKIMGPDGVAKTFVVTGDHYYAITTGDKLDDSASNEVELDSIDANVTKNAKNCNIEKGSLVAYDASADGKINAEDLYVLLNGNVDDADVQVVEVTGAFTVKDEAQKIVAGKSYYANSKTSYLNMNVNNIEKIDGWDSLVSNDADSATEAADNTDNLAVDNTRFDEAGAFYIVLEEEDSNIIKQVIVDLDQDQPGNAASDTSSQVYLNSDADYGIYVESDSDSDDDYVTLFINGSEQRYTASGSFSGSEYDKGDLVKFEVNGDGEFDISNDTLRAAIADMQDYTDDGDTDNDGIVDDVAKDVYKVDSYAADDRVLNFVKEGDRTINHEEGSVDVVKLASDAVVYSVDADGKVTAATLSDISKGKYVAVDDFDTEDEVYSVVVIFD